MGSRARADLKHVLLQPGLQSALLQPDQQSVLLLPDLRTAALQQALLARSQRPFRLHTLLLLATLRQWRWPQLWLWL